MVVMYALSMSLVALYYANADPCDHIFTRELTKLTKEGEYIHKMLAVPITVFS